MGYACAQREPQTNCEEFQNDIESNPPKGLHRDKISAIMSRAGWETVSVCYPATAVRIIAGGHGANEKAIAVGRRKMEFGEVRHLVRLYFLDCKNTLF